MERTKKAPVNNTKQSISPELNQKIQTFSQLVGRAELIAKFGMAYGTDRDLYEALGYKTTLTYEDFMARYERQDIAKAIIDRPVKATWQGVLQLLDNPSNMESEFTTAYKELDKKLKLKNKFLRVDKLANIGEYAILLLGLDDVNDRNGFKKPVGKKKLDLLYAKPFGMDKARIQKYVESPRDPRYGLPELYEMTVPVANEDNTENVIVHHSRVIHVVWDNLESEIKGAPMMMAPYNRLMDLEKIVGGDAEMFWRGARPGYHGKVSDDFQLTKEMQDDLINQIDEFEHNFRRVLVNEGIDLDALAQQIADPTTHVDVQIQMISAVTGIPKRILTGSERGELSSAQDKAEYLSYVTTRREEHAEPNIIEPFVDKCMEYGILPEVEEYQSVWEDLFVLNEKERVEVGHKRAAAVREYTQNPMAEYIIPPEVFVDVMLGLSDLQKKKIMGSVEEALAEERPVTPQEESIISEESVALTANDSGTTK
jgi:hypothetical protein